jgi:uracil-DNA glycosylase family 4
MTVQDDLEALSREVAECRRCERLVAWREEAAANPPRRYRGQTYWARPVPGFGDPRASIVLVGLAPAAHGANRTGRMFTGDRSGDWLYAALHRAGLANQPTATAIDDGLALEGAYITAPVRCAPPANKPNIVERDTCKVFLERELTLLTEAKVILALGAYAWDAVLRTARSLGHPVPRPKPRHGHGAEAAIGPWTLLGSYHPSQQNTFTGRLTEAMLDDVMRRARELAGAPDLS